MDWEPTEYSQHTGIVAGKNCHFMDWSYIGRPHVYIVMYWLTFSTKVR